MLRKYGSMLIHRCGFQMFSSPADRGLNLALGYTVCLVAHYVVYIPNLMKSHAD